MVKVIVDVFTYVCVIYCISFGVLVFVDWWRKKHG